MLKEKIKNWLNKEREGFIFGFSSWILNSPRALDILFTIGHLVSIFLFGGLAIISYIFKWWILMVISIVCLIVCIRNTYRFFKFAKNSIEGMNMQEMLYKEKIRLDKEVLLDNQDGKQNRDNN